MPLFGIKQEIAIAIAVALFALLAGSGLYIRHVFNERADLELRTTQQAAAIRGHEVTEAALHDDAARKERSYAENARQRAALTAALNAANGTLADFKRNDPQYHKWGDAVLPDSYDRWLRASAGASPAPVHQAVTPGGTARRNPAATVHGTDAVHQ